MHIRRVRPRNCQISISKEVTIVDVHENEEDSPIASYFCAEILLQAVDACAIESPEIRVLTEPMPRLDRREFPFQVNTAAEVEQLLDDGRVRVPSRVRSRRVWCERDQGSRHHHHVVGWIWGGWIGWIGDMLHAWMLQGQDKVHSHLEIADRARRCLRLGWDGVGALIGGDVER